MERLQFEVPDRSGLPAFEKYAHLIIPGDGYRIVGSTEASRGCKHLCRHCPIVPVYNGVFRIVPREIVMEDVRRQVAAGAQHISFGDPDFFNGIGHAIPLVEEFHREFPDVTYDVTIKIEHLRKYEDQLPKLKATGCLFVISAVESVDDAVLAALEKGHTRADFLHVVARFRASGNDAAPHVRSVFSVDHARKLSGFAAGYLPKQELTENVAPIQLGIRLLIPEGSRMLELRGHPRRHRSVRFAIAGLSVEACRCSRGRACGESTGNCCSSRSRESQPHRGVRTGLESRASYCGSCSAADFRSSSRCRAQFRSSASRGTAAPNPPGIS